MNGYSGINSNSNFKWQENEKSIKATWITGKKESIRFEGIIPFISRHSEESTAGVQRWAQSFMNKIVCSTCEGTRLRKEAHYFKIDNYHIGDLAGMDLNELKFWFDKLESKLEEKKQKNFKKFKKRRNDEDIVIDMKKSLIEISYNNSPMVKKAYMKKHKIEN